MATFRRSEKAWQPRYAPPEGSTSARELLAEALGNHGLRLEALSEECWRLGSIDRARGLGGDQFGESVASGGFRFLVATTFLGRP